MSNSNPISTPRIQPSTDDIKYSLYVKAFQNPKASVAFLTQLFEQQNSRFPLSLREDFCGTAAICTNWVESDPQRTAMGVDIDPEPLAWCCDHLASQLQPAQRSRLELVCADVLEVAAQPTDLILAFNCSFCVLKRRNQLNAYFRDCRSALVDDGMLVLELYAGPEAQMVGIDRVHCGDFVAIWEQASFDAVTNEALNFIHFEKADGSRNQKAFAYDWRLWTPAEIIETLLECGFRDTKVFRKQETIGGQFSISESRHADVPDYWELFVVGIR